MQKQKLRSKPAANKDTIMISVASYFYGLFYILPLLRINKENRDTVCGKVNWSHS